MKHKILFKDLPCIKDKAYFIMAGLTGSWLFEATYPQNQDEEWCKRFVEHFVGDHGDTIEYTIQGDTYRCSINESIQQQIDDSYEDMLKYRAAQLITK